MIAARGDGWYSSLPKILKMDPDNCPYHDEYTGHSCRAEEEKKRRKQGQRTQGEGLEEEPKEGREKEGWNTWGFYLQCACCSRYKDSLRVTDAVCLRVCDHLDCFFFLF